MVSEFHTAIRLRVLRVSLKTTIQCALFIFGVLYTAVCKSQFTEITSTLDAEIIMPPNVYGSAISFYDFNGDGWDDLTISTRNNDPKFFMNNDGELVPAPFEIPNIGYRHIIAMLWADINNDGYADLLITKKNAAVELYLNNGDLTFTNITATAGLPSGSYNYKGAAFCDYDHDGYLDVYISKYHHPDEGGIELESGLFKNMGNNTFTDVTESAGVQIPPRPTFQPVFIDVNNDGWEDLYLAIDRQEFANELFINNGDGTFTNTTQTSGANIYVCSMTATVGDFNHDQMLDIYVTSHPTTNNILLQNEGFGNFSNAIPQFPNLAVGLSCWGSMWLDYDNDSWEDLYVGSMIFGPPPGNQFYRNNQGNSFTSVSNTLNINVNPSESYVCAKGDINNDGYFDFAITNRAPNPSRVFLNNGGNNNYLSISLEGTYSNRDGIGTWLHCYANGEHFVRFTLCGENFYGQNSKKQIFGLGDIGLVDSLVIEWNRGTRDVYYNLTPNQHLHLLEGQSNLDGFAISTADNLSWLCPGDSLVLDAGEYSSYLWNTGHTGQYLSVADTGSYFVEVTNEIGATGTSQPFDVEFAPEPEVTWHIDDVSCYGAQNGSIFLEISPGDFASIHWNSGDNSPYIANLSPGVYTFEAIDSYGCTISQTDSIHSPDSLWGIIQTFDVSCFGSSDGQVITEAQGGVAPYLYFYFGQNPMALASGEHAVLITDWNNCTTLQFFSIEEPDSLYLDLFTIPETLGGTGGAATVEINGGTPPYEILWSNGESDVWSIANLTAGEYDLTVSDNNGCFASSTFTIEMVSSLIENATHSLKLFPNPFNDWFQLTGCTDQLSQLSIYSNSGREVFETDRPLCNKPIFIGNLPPGIYVVSITTLSGEKSFHKLVKTNP